MRGVVPHRREGLELKMTPMIDVVFLLLIFFLWTSSFQPPEFDLPGSLASQPEAGTFERGEDQPPAEMFDEIVIEVRGTDLAAPQLSLNGQAIANLSALATQLETIAALGIQPPVIIDPADATPIGAAIRVYDVARGVGLERVLFAARR